MPAYLLLDITWHDPAKANEYREKLGPTLDKYHARTLVAAPVEVLEGTWAPARVVVIEFPSMDALHDWYRSEEYAPLLELRKAAAATNMLAVDRPPA
jgi:uncharacterized protein (DUF1330 family)